MTECKADQIVPPSSNTEVQNRNNFTTTILKRLQCAQSELSESDVISTGSLLASDRVVKLTTHLHLALG